ncbi:MAG: DUF1722 domain-containing protein, partial [Candidatus Bipolaricaulota bacterium]|nr:DUF1722 domain-containing protein [Candidatus Bipolaricaulota bacterium]
QHRASFANLGGIRGVMQVYGTTSGDAHTTPCAGCRVSYNRESASELAVARPPRRTSAINVLEHAFGYVSDDLSAPEKAFFLETLDAYRAAAPLGARSRLASSLVVRVALTYLDEQIFFQPFPQDLVDVLDSGKRRGVR